MQNKVPRQTYEEYLETMKAYRFSPMERELWEDWEAHYVKLRGD